MGNFINRRRGRRDSAAIYASASNAFSEPEAPVNPEEKEKVGVLAHAGSEVTASYGAHPLHRFIPRNSRVGKLITVYALGEYLYKAGREFYNDRFVVHTEKNKYVLVLEENAGDIYGVVVDWLKQFNDEDERHETRVAFEYNRRKGEYRPKQIIDMDGVYNVFMHDLPVTVLVGTNVEELAGAHGAVTVYKSKEIKFLVESYSDTQKVQDFMIELWDSFMESQRVDDVDEDAHLGRSLDMRSYRTGGWMYKEFRSRDKASVALPRTDKDDLFNDMQRFLDLREEYRRIDVPWHRGYLFEGPPGTGKTSLAIAVTTYFGITAYYMPLSSVKTDSDLTSAIQAIDDEEAVLILEDIDIIKATNERHTQKNDSNDGVTLAGLLNVLDGFNTPSGLITIITTNDRDSLDPALIRPGRVDVELSVGYLKDDQLQDMMQWYLRTDEPVDLPKIEHDIVPASVVGIVKNNIGNPEQMLLEVKRLIAEGDPDAVL